MEDLWQPENEQEEIQEATKEDDPQERRLQRIPLTEQHRDWIALGDVEAMRPSRRMRNVEALQQRVMVRREVCSCGQQTWRFREPQCGDRYQDKRESAADDVDDRPAKALGQQERDDQTADKAAE